jgi:hypothetical protein
MANDDYLNSSNCVCFLNIVRRSVKPRRISLTLRLDNRELSTPNMAPNSPRTILILAANPADQPQLRLDQEVREIQMGSETLDCSLKLSNNGRLVQRTFAGHFSITIQPTFTFAAAMAPELRVSFWKVT